jgi:hypothetical protein
MQTHFKEIKMRNFVILGVSALVFALGAAQAFAYGPGPTGGYVGEQNATAGYSVPLDGR